MSDYGVYVKLVNEEDGKEYNEAGLHYLLTNYVFNPVKTWIDTKRVQTITGDFNGCEPFFFYSKYEEHDPEKIFQLMMLNHKIMRPLETERLAKHRIVSFPPDSMLLASDLGVLGRLLAKYYSSYGFIAAYAVHADHNNMHIHLVVDAFSFKDGNRFSIPYEHNKVQSIVSSFMSDHEDLLRRDCRYREQREAVYYGSELRYESVPVSGIEQMALNRKKQML